MESEKSAIQRSMSAYNESPIEPDAVAIRASTIVEADDWESAFQLAEPRIDEALDVLTAINPTRDLSAYRLMEAGCTRDLSTGAVTARTPRHEWKPWMSYMITGSPREWPPRDLAQYALGADRSELGARYVRAAHWSRKADLELNPHMAMLFEWFTAESSWSVVRDDDVIPAIRWTLGFANGQGGQLLSAETQLELATDDQYRPWGRRIEQLLQKIRTIRNQTVHNGFRLIDVPPEDLDQLRTLARLAARGALTCMAHGILADLDSASELVDYLPLLMGPNLVKTAKNVIRIISDSAST
jgi:hypothetical protein